MGHLQVQQAAASERGYVCCQQQSWQGRDAQLSGPQMIPLQAPGVEYGNAGFHLHLSLHPHFRCTVTSCFTFPGLRDCVPMNYKGPNKPFPH